MPVASPVAPSIDVAPAKRSFYSTSVGHFLAEEFDAIVGRLSSRPVAFHAAAEAEQIRAWECEIELLRIAFVEVGEAAQGWSILIEVPLLRLGKRLRVVLLAPGVVALVEFKIGATGYDAAAKAQTERYAHSLRDFREVSQRRLLIPILCAEKAPDRSTAIAVAERLEEVNAFEPTSVAEQRNVPHVEALAAAVDESLVRTFGADTLDYRRYSDAGFFNNGPFNYAFEVPITQVHASLSRSKARSIALLTQAIKSLEERLVEFPATALQHSRV